MKKTRKRWKFTPKIVEKLKKLYLDGKTNKEAAAEVGCNVSTIKRWRMKYPEFNKDVVDWKLKADEEIERSLYESARGYRTTVKKAVVVSDGRDSGSHVETVEEEIAFQPNPISIKFWLTNRKPKTWRDRQEVDNPALHDLVKIILPAKDKEQ